MSVPLATALFVSAYLLLSASAMNLFIHEYWAGPGAGLLTLREDLGAVERAVGTLILAVALPAVGCFLVAVLIQLVLEAGPGGPDDPEGDAS